MGSEKEKKFKKKKDHLSLFLSEILNSYKLLEISKYFEVNEINK